MHRLLIVFLACLLACSQARHRNQPTDHSDGKEIKTSEVDTLQQVLDNFELSLKKGLEAKKIPGAAVVIIKDTAVVYMKGFGLRSSSKDDSVDINTVFRIGSLSKGFASVLAGIQVEKGCFDWNQRVKSFVPEFVLKDKQQTERVTVKHILSHSSGLPRHAYTTLIEDGLSLDRIIPRLGKVKLIGKEGVHLAYQNAAYCIIEKVLESDLGYDFNDILQDQLLIPAGMTNTGCTYESIKANTNVAVPHRWRRIKRKYVPTKINRRFFNAVAAGGIHTSISDMSNWLQVLLGNRPDIISDKMLDEVFTPVVRLGNRRYFRKWKGVKESWYALGWRTFEYQGRKMIYHSGSVNNYRGEITIDRENKLAICILLNSTSGFAASVAPMFFTEYGKLMDSHKAQ